MTRFTDKQRAELRDAIARSRIEASREAKRIAANYAAKQAAVQKAVLDAAPPAHKLPSAYDLTGLLAETLTALELQVADMDDDELSALTHLARLRVTAVGDALVRRKTNLTGRGLN